MINYIVDRLRSHSALLTESLSTVSMKYSELAWKLDFDKLEKLLPDDRFAWITHFLQRGQNDQEHQRYEHARDYIDKLVVGGFESVTQIDWDIPYPPPIAPDFTFIDLFAGIGGFRIAMQSLNGKCVFSSEWDRFAQKTYQANFGEVPFGDIRHFTDENIVEDERLNFLIPDHDVLCAGFPCQPFSLAGVSKKNSLGRAHGFLDETQGTLFFDLARIIEVKRPRAFILENVKNLRSHDGGRTYATIKKVLDKLEYKVFDTVLDGKHYVPQHRERIFFVGFDLHEYEDIEFDFPHRTGTPMSMEDILELNVDAKYTHSDHLWSYLKQYAQKHAKAGNGFGYQLAPRLGISRTLSARYHKDGSEILIAQEGNNPRKLTPTECAALQGYDRDRFVIPVSDTQAYRQFGNSVVVPLIQDVAQNLVNILIPNEVLVTG